MKRKAKVWQIVLSAVAGVAVVGGGATGIWYGVTHSSADPAMEPAASIVESGTDAQALDEPTATAPVSTEEETKTSTEKQTTKESTSESVTSTTEGTIRFEYDPDLSLNLSHLLAETRPGSTVDSSLFHDSFHPENFISRDGRSINTGVNNYHWFVGYPSSLTAKAIAEAWTNFRGIGSEVFFIQVYVYSNDWVYVIFS